MSVKSWIFTILIAVEFFAVGALAFSLSMKIQQCNNLQDRVKEQSTVIKKNQSTIDSLLKRDKFIDVELNVTDKSHANIYGRYNKGTITLPNEKVYILKIDSTNVTMR